MCLHKKEISQQTWLWPSYAPHTPKVFAVCKSTIVAWSSRVSLSPASTPKQDSLHLDSESTCVRSLVAHVLQRRAHRGVTVLYIPPAAAPGGLCVFPGKRAAPLCSSSSSSAWSYRASLDTAQAEAGRSAATGDKKWRRSSTTWCLFKVANYVNSLWPVFHNSNICV